MSNVFERRKFVLSFDRLKKDSTHQFHNIAATKRSLTLQNVFKSGTYVSLSILSPYTQFQANRLKNGNVTPVFHFWVGGPAGRLVGW